MPEYEVPRHVAIIMDGNGRWAKQRGKPRTAGHSAGVESLRKAIKFAIEKNISVLSVFAFSTENWRRPKLEVATLMRLFLRALRTEVVKLHENNVRLRVIGDISQFSKSIQKGIVEAEALTRDNTRMTLVIAANYGGRWDILYAVKQLLKEVHQGNFSIEQINEENFSQYLSVGDLPDPDLFIRTSGEERVSNFFLWQLAYTELYFSPAYWPDFDEAEFGRALLAYQERDRRFGRDEVK